MIGNKADAALAANFIVTFDEDTWDEIVEGMPEGWKFLGSGCSREAFLSPDGVVYKREPHTAGMVSTNNANEYAFYKSNSETIAGFRLAACYLWENNVLAMEYAKDDGSNVDRVWETMRDTMRERFNYHDCAKFKRGDNWHGVAGNIILTDYSY